MSRMRRQCAALLALVVALPVLLLAQGSDEALEKLIREARTSPGNPQPTSTPDKTRRDFHPNCLEAGCHAQLHDTRWVHGPVAAAACSTCHQDVGPAADHRYEPVRAKEERCSACHAHPEPKKIRHEPFAKFDCPRCHNPHGGSTRAFLADSTLQAVCVRCHDGMEHDGKVISPGPREVEFPHRPAAQGECAACHSAHQADYEHLLVREEKSSLCLECHGRVRLIAAVDTTARLEGKPPGVFRLAPFPRDTIPGLAGQFAPAFLPDSSQEAVPADTTALFVTVHRPLIRDCGSCHVAHGSDFGGMTSQSPGELCQSCHEDLEQRRTVARSNHGTGLGKEGCADCHSPHASVHEDLLVDSSTPLCLRCHRRLVRGSAEREIPSIQAQIFKAKSVHGPVTHNCTACHLAHASPNQDLLRAHHPETTYASYTAETYGLCFHCHDRGPFELELTDLTSFRDGDRNLHYIHVHQEKGRTCGRCHEPHASKAPKLIARSAPFGPIEWPLPITFEMGPTGGSCEVGCHRVRGYDRLNPVNPRPEAESDSISN